MGENQGEVKRIQDVASVANATDTIPAEFIRPEDERPGLTTYKGDLPEVPVVDFSIKDDEKLVAQIYDVSCKWGFFQIVNHEIPNDVISKLKEVGTTFFELPQEEKEVYAKPPGAKSMEGYGTKLQKEVNGIKGWVDHLFHILSPPSAVNYKFWPKNPPSYRETNEEYTKYLHKVEERLLRCLSKGIGLEENELRAAVGGDDLVYLLKINYYPPCPRPDLALGVPAHTDMSAVTILVPNDVQGLQVFHEGNWIDAQYIPNALVIHIGDQLEILSNGKYKAVLHRTTVNKEKTRLSWPVFMEPPQDMEVGPHPKLVNNENPAKYKTKKYSDYVYCKFNKIPQ
ncbi:Flavonol synthase [Heracleum sosnowskyi]|uniref:Flavonol synthase n=1 Tax=Heracleum sosnowskyi TaxID=360622 RepID=A0AAD8MGD9_9APIA|nr:Flavonol synthase [Heracleum sosnowskyi]